MILFIVVVLWDCLLNVNYIKFRLSVGIPSQILCYNIPSGRGIGPKMKTVIYFYESAFMMWRRRLAGISAVASDEGWPVESVDVGELEHGVRPVLAYWMS